MQSGEWPCTIMHALGRHERRMSDQSTVNKPIRLLLVSNKYISVDSMSVGWGAPQLVCPTASAYTLCISICCLLIAKNFKLQSLLTHTKSICPT